MSALEAKLKAEGEYEVYRKKQDAEFISDFDRVVAETKRIEGGGRPGTGGEGAPKPRPPTKTGKGSSKPRRKR